MASLSRDDHGWRTRLVDPKTKKRHTIRYGQCAAKNAQLAHNMVERLIEAKLLGTPIDGRTAGWLEDVDDALRDKLAKIGLVEESRITFLKAFLDGVVGQRVRRGDVKECTVVSWGHTTRNLTEFFGADCEIDTITSADADEWAAWLVDHEKLAENTVRKRSANAKMFFRVALRRKQIIENPFEGLVGSVVPSRGRQYFVPRETVTALLDQCHGPEYRLILLFARYMGVRVPSEIVPLTWGDVDWDNRRIIITSPKTERHSGGDKRICPIFPEAFPALQEAYEAAPEGAVRIFPSIRSGEKNMGTWLRRAILAAGFTPWPRLWQNFRATRATELADQFPSRVAASWLGHSEQIADAHYRQATDTHYQQAIEHPTGAMPESGPYLAHSPPVTPPQASRKKSKNPGFPGFEENCLGVQNTLVGDDGLEPPTSTV